MSEFRRIAIADARPLTTGFRLGWMQQANAAAAPTATNGTADEDGYALGFTEGWRQAELRFEADRTRFRELIASCELLRPEPSEELAVLIAETVGGLVRTIAGEIAIDADLLADRARAAAELIGEADSARTLHLHPDDAALVDPTSIALHIVADPNQARGSVRIDCSTGWIEDGIPARLDALRDQLGLAEGSQ